MVAVVARFAVNLRCWIVNLFADPSLAQGYRRSAIATVVWIVTVHFVPTVLPEVAARDVLFRTSGRQERLIFQRAYRVLEKEEAAADVKKASQVCHLRVVIKKHEGKLRSRCCAITASELEV